MAYKVIQVGTGGRGRSWCANILPPNIQDKLVEVVAAVDLNPEVLIHAAFKLMKTASVVLAITRARVVFPVPGGP